MAFFDTSLRISLVSQLKPGASFMETSFDVVSSMTKSSRKAPNISNNRYSDFMFHKKKCFVYEDVYSCGDFVWKNRTVILISSR